MLTNILRSLLCAVIGHRYVLSKYLDKSCARCRVRLLIDDEQEHRKDRRTDASNRSNPTD